MFEKGHFCDVVKFRIILISISFFMVAKNIVKTKAKSNVKILTKISLDKILQARLLKKITEKGWTILDLTEGLKVKNPYDSNSFIS